MSKREEYGHITTSEEIEAYNKGYEDSKLGLTVFDNPYSTVGDEFFLNSAWETGFYDYYYE